MPQYHPPITPWSDEELDPLRSMSFTTIITADMSSPTNKQESSSRKGSVWNNAFDGFKFQKQADGLRSSTEEIEPHFTITSVQTNEKDAHTYSVNETKPLEQEPKRSISSAIADVFRRGSNHSEKGKESADPQAHLIPHHLGIRKGSIFHSSNPDYDSELPRKGSTTSQHSTGSGESPTARNGSLSHEGAENEPKARYVPRNATTSFLTSTTLKTSEERHKIQEEKLHEGNMAVPTAGRKASVAALSDSSDGGHSAAGYTSANYSTSRNNSVNMPSGRRPSGMIPNNVATRYMRTASQSNESGEGGRRPSDGRKNSNGESKVTAVYMPPDQHQIWQNAVSRNTNRFPIAKPGETSTAADKPPMRMASITDIIAEAPEPSTQNRAPGASVSSPSPAKVRKQFSIDTFSDEQRLGTDKYLEDQISPRHDTFASRYQTDEPESPLESLGFRGAVPA